MSADPHFTATDCSQRVLGPLLVLVMFCILVSMPGCRAQQDADGAEGQEGARRLAEALANATPRRGDAEAALFTSLEPSTATIGDRVRYVLELETAPGIDLLLPSFGGRVAELPILEQSAAERSFEDGSTLRRLELVLRAESVGTFTLPEVSAVDPKMSPAPGQEREVPPGETPESEETRRLPTGPERLLSVESVLPADDQALDIRDVKPVRRIESGWAWWRWVLVAAAFLLMSFAAWRWWRSRHVRAALRDHRRMLSAHEWAFARLEELRRTDFSDLRELRRYYFQLSEVLRSYIERRFVLNATDLTSEEILARARHLEGLDVSLQRRLAGFLIATDMVKYAAQIPAREEIEETFEAALSFVEQTVPPPVSEDEESSEGEARSSRAHGAAKTLHRPGDAGLLRREAAADASLDHEDAQRATEQLPSNGSRAE